MNRYFYRCTGCLEVVALADKLAMEYSGTVAKCGTCDQRFDYMGRVTRDRLLMDTTQCACDDRCTCARGPICSCSCGGENHGAGMAGYITVITDIGAAPKVTMPDTKSKTKALAQWLEYSELRTVALAALDRLSDRRKRGEFLPRSEWDRMVQLRQALGKASKAKSHAGRIKTLAAILQPVAA